MLVDDHPSFRKGMTALIESESDLRVVAEASNGCHALETYRRAEPDIVLMDLHMPVMGGVEATIAICKEFPDACVIILSNCDMDEDIFCVIRSWAKAYLLKYTPPDELAGTIRAVHAGKHLLSPTLSERFAARWQCSNLTEQEPAVPLLLLAKCHSNVETRTGYFTSGNTIKRCLKMFLNKFKVKNRINAKSANKLNAVTANRNPL